MANRHFAKLADVWKHRPLVEILSIERPGRYWESHAGSATYEMVDDPERRYGVLSFLETAPHLPALARSRYLAHLSSMRDPVGHLMSYPGSPMLAALELGSECRYLVWDLDPQSVANLRATALQLGIASRVQIIDSDGMTALHQGAPHLRAERVNGRPHRPLRSPSRRPRRPIGAGSRPGTHRAAARPRVWYGYDRPERRAWAFEELAKGSQDRSIWCGDVMVTTPGADPAGGDLGLATTPGTGFGIVCANLSTTAIDACQQLGHELAAAYDGVPLPDGRPGRLEFHHPNRSPQT